jgi:hypothetical protein
MTLPWDRELLTLWQAVQLVVVLSNERGKELAARGGDYYSWRETSYIPEDKACFDAFSAAITQLSTWLRRAEIAGRGQHPPNWEKGPILREQWFAGTPDFKEGGLIGSPVTDFVRQVHVYAEDIRRLCGKSADAPSPYHTGAPGRPSPIQFIEDEFERRIDAKEIEPTVTEQGKVLYEWCREAHPKIAAPRPKTIENQIRERFNEAKSSRPQN